MSIIYDDDLDGMEDDNGDSDDDEDDEWCWVMADGPGEGADCQQQSLCFVWFCVLSFVFCILCFDDEDDEWYWVMGLVTGLTASSSRCYRRKCDGWVSHISFHDDQQHGDQHDHDDHDDGGQLHISLDVMFLITPMMTLIQNLSPVLYIMKQDHLRWIKLWWFKDSEFKFSLTCSN